VFLQWLPNQKFLSKSCVRYRGKRVQLSRIIGTYAFSGGTRTLVS